MTTVSAHAERKSSQISATIIRCGCGDPATHAGAICPRPLRIEKRGMVSFAHRNSTINWLGNIWIRAKDEIRKFKESL